MENKQQVQAIEHMLPDFYYFKHQNMVLGSTPYTQGKHQYYSCVSQ